MPAPKIDSKKFAAHLARNKKPKKMTSTQKSLADISKRANTFARANENYDKEPPSPDEKSMAMRQAKFIGYVAEEIMEHVEGDNDFPEWMQNKLSEFHQKAKDMHSTMAGEYEDDEEEMDESISEKLSVSDGMGTWIDDFKKSDAPQFKDKSDKERRDMAIAAYLSAKKDKQEGYVSMAQQRAVWATRKDGGKGHPDNKKGKKK